MLDLNEFKNEVHQNAVDHGWWDDDRANHEVFALIHSEWSEALEEDRAGRPMVWYECADGVEAAIRGCGLNGVCEEMHMCDFRKAKPEGVAVELIDGIIRILDLCGREGYNLRDPKIRNNAHIRDMSLSRLIVNLHTATSSMWQVTLSGTESQAILQAGWQGIINQVFSWLIAHDCDPYEIVVKKHEYNKTRPKKHGKLY